MLERTPEASNSGRTDHPKFDPRHPSSHLIRDAVLFSASERGKRINRVLSVHGRMEKRGGENNQDN